MTDPTKKVQNPLFNIAVTGGTLEEFSQHALLLPAKEKPPPPVLNITQEQILGDQTSSSAFESSPSNIFDAIETQPQQEILQPPPIIQEINLQQPTEPNSSILSSVFSSFSKKLIAPAQIQEIPSVAPPAGIESIIGQQEPTNIQPIPLFPAASASQAPKPLTPPSTGPANSFRRTGLKRPTYAQVPGLSSNVQSSPIQNFPPISQQTIPPLPTHNPIDPYLNSNLSYTPTPQEQTFNTNPAIRHIQEAPALHVQQSPVMTAIPASEALNNPNMAVDPSVINNNNPVNNNFAPTASTNRVYRPVYHHWFHKRELEGKVLWTPFSMNDSLKLENAFTSIDLDPDKVIATDGGRFDVNILRRQRAPVYWDGSPTEVRRCSWFCKDNTDGKYIPYEENVATKLEDEYKIAFEHDQWNKRVELVTGESVVFHGPEVLVLFPPSQSPDAWANSQNQNRARTVKRGLDEFNIDEGEPERVDHLLFMVHGIGSVCDLKFRKVEEVVDEFRSISLQLLEAHYHSSCEQGIANRIEVLPISWHHKLHSEDTGIDKKLKSITLKSIPKLRDFTNDTLLDVLFYTSPIYCQTIMTSVGNEINRIYELYKKRNPSFSGGVSLGGHSLGSLILFDLLAHQHHTEPDIKEEIKEEENASNGNEPSPSPAPVPAPAPVGKKLNRRISYMMGNLGSNQPQINYPQLKFNPLAFFAMGSPIGMFVTVRGLNSLGEEFALPTCPKFFNIFHPYDPVAYRIESLINPELGKLNALLIPHHKGRKRMHLELKETMARVGADLKQRVFDSMKSTWNSVYQLAMFHKQTPPSLEEEVTKVFQEQISSTETTAEEETQPDPKDLPLGVLNGGRRIDYVLQEAPFEFFNEYIFALTSHVCYWDSEDTMLLILKEIYSSMDISPDNQIPQQTMTIERPPPSPKSTRANAQATGMDPTAPVQKLVNLQPPPTMGFVKKT